MLPQRKRALIEQRIIMADPDAYQALRPADQAPARQNVVSRTMQTPRAVGTEMISAPEPLHAGHILTSFFCGVILWITGCSAGDEKSGLLASRTLFAVTAILG